MGDIVIGVMIVGLSAVGLGLGTARLSRAWSPRASLILALAAVGVILLQVSILRDSLRLASLLPCSGVIVLGEWLPLPVAVFVGLARARMPGPAWRKSVALGLLTIAALYLTYRPILGAPPPCGDLWQDGVCMQTSDASCSAACAATLLRYHGLPATEGEMASLCFTRPRGTSMLGLYRGLVLKTRGTPWQVAVLSGRPADLGRKLSGPAILSVGLNWLGAADPRYERDWGWARGQAHAVVIFGFTSGGMVEMGDPSVGREKWLAQALDVLWRGEGLCLVPRRQRE